MDRWNKYYSVYQILPEIATITTNRPSNGCMPKFALGPFPDRLKDQIIPWIKCVNGHQTDLSTLRNFTKLILSLGHPVDE